MATNNQNPMESRNLKSNEEAQIAYERFFADLGWFYERKDFAWQAFERDPNHWSTLTGKTTRDFQANKSGGRPTHRRAENEQIAQTWLSFIGFVDEAVQRKADIFSSDKVYRRVFQLSPVKHSADYDGDTEKLDEEAKPQSPPAAALLLAFLTYLLAKKLVPSQKMHRQTMVKELGISDLPQTQQDEKLREKKEYVSGLAIAASPFLFCEFVGYVFFKALGVKFYEAAEDILQDSDINDMFKYMDQNSFISKLNQRNVGQKDLFAQLWLAFNDIISWLVEDPIWRIEFYETSSKPRFMYKRETRRKILNKLDTHDSVCSKRKLHEIWSEHFDQAHGIYELVRKLYKKKTK